jgi:hypothetical protein
MGASGGATTNMRAHLVHPKDGHAERITPEWVAELRPKKESGGNQSNLDGFVTKDDEGSEVSVPPRE